MGLLYHLCSVALFMWLVYSRSTRLDTLETKLMTIREVAQLLRVDDTTVRRWIKVGTLPAIILPHIRKRRAFRVRRDTIEALLQGAENERTTLPIE